MFHSATIPDRQGTQVLDSLGIQWRGYNNATFPLASNQYYDLSFPYNSGKPTKVWGLEVEHQTNFRFLPGLLKNIVLSYNFSFIKSEAFILTSEQEAFLDTTFFRGNPIIDTSYRTIMVEKKQRLEDQPEFFANASLGYDIDGFSFRVSLFYQGSYNATFFI